MNNIILASASPRRKDILSEAGFKFKVIPSCYEEKIANQKYSDDIIKNCAYQKALDVQNKTNSDYLIVGADTVVVLDSIIMGKPKDKNNAFEMLKALSNNTHFVSSAVCLLYKDKKIIDNEITKVTFRELKDEEIINYINSKNPLDKAGSYGIQDDGFNFASSIDGELDNVVGFPLKLFLKLYENIKS